MAAFLESLKLLLIKASITLLLKAPFWYIAYIVFALFMVDKIAPYKAVTLPNLIEKNVWKKVGFSEHSLIFSTFFQSATSSVSGYSFSYFLTFHSMNPCSLEQELSLLQQLWGTRSVVFSDLIQFFVMCLGVASVLLFSIFQFGGFSFLETNLFKLLFTNR